MLVYIIIPIGWMFIKCSLRLKKVCKIAKLRAKEEDEDKDNYNVGLPVAGTAII